jgi:hypothetical protein
MGKQWTDLKEKLGQSRPVQWAKRWDYALIYIAILLIGLFTVELRVGPIWSSGRLAQRVPLLVAAFNWIFRPDQMQYAAVSDLKVNHQIHPYDLTFHPQLDKVLCNYLPRLEDITDKYLKSEVAAGKPVLLQNLSQAPKIKPQSNSYVVGVRLGIQSTSSKFLEPESKVVLAPLNSTERLQGTVVGGTWEKPSAPSAAKTSETDKKKTESNASSNQPSPRPGTESAPKH